MSLHLHRLYGSITTRHIPCVQQGLDIPTVVLGVAQVPEPAALTARATAVVRDRTVDSRVADHLSGHYHQVVVPGLDLGLIEEDLLTVEEAAVPLTLPLLK